MALLQESREWPEQIQIYAFDIHLADSEYAKNRVDAWPGWEQHGRTNLKETAMSQQQKDALKELIRNAPLDIGGDVIEQRTNFEKMLSARPLADDVSTTPGDLGGVPVLNIETGE